MPNSILIFPTQGPFCHAATHTDIIQFDNLLFLLFQDRDDELASCVQITNDLHAAGFKFELAVSETKPFTRIGSDEDDCDDTSILSGAEDLSESAVARDACKEAAAAMATTESTNDIEECEDLTNQISRCQNEATNRSTSTDSEENAEQVSLDG